MPFPASVFEMLRGDIGDPLGGWPANLKTKVMKGAPPVTGHGASITTPADFDRARTEAKGRCGRSLDDRELASYLLHPEVFVDLNAAVECYGPVSSLPTATFFWGMTAGEEVEVALEPGKTLVISLQAVGDADEEGRVRVFFELNGQSRVIVALNRSVVRGQLPRRKAEDTDPLHIAAPMPGIVSRVAVKPGDKVKSGDVVLTVEAMKMEATVHAPHEGEIQEVLVRPGSAIEANDLVAIYTPGRRI